MVKVYFGAPEESGTIVVNGTTYRDKPRGPIQDFVSKTDFDRAISLLRLYHEGHSPEEQAEVSRETEEFLEECK